MRISFTRVSGGKQSFFGAACASLTSALALTVFLLMLFGNPTPGRAIPAFARKYGLPCSACHEAWPMLNTFGQTFKDNGYQLMNDRDSPIWQNPSYWPATLRVTPNWNHESTNKVAIDQPDGTTVEKNLSVNGFDLSGMDFLTGGTLYKNILLPPGALDGQHRSLGPGERQCQGRQHRPQPWFNFKFGKFELDNIISEKRILTLSNNGGYYVLYHFIPAGDSNFSARWATTSWAWRLAGTR